MKIREGSATIEIPYSELRILRQVLETMYETHKDCIYDLLEDNDDLSTFEGMLVTIQSALDRTVIYKGE
jgi:hypothetical protein